MRNYEALIAINPSLTEERVNTVIARLEKRVTDNGGEIIKTQKMGVKKLPFTFSKHKRLKDALFAVIEYKSEGKATEALINLLRLQEEVVRHMVTQKEIVKASLENEIVPQTDAPDSEKPSAAVLDEGLADVQP